MVNVHFLAITFGGEQPKEKKQLELSNQEGIDVFKGSVAGERTITQAGVGLISNLWTSQAVHFIDPQMANEALCVRRPSLRRIAKLLQLIKRSVDLDDSQIVAHAHDEAGNAELAGVLHCFL